jgi:hypothetical protein
MKEKNIIQGIKGTILTIIVIGSMVIVPICYFIKDVRNDTLTLASVIGLLLCVSFFLCSEYSIIKYYFTEHYFKWGLDRFRYLMG